MTDVRTDYQPTAKPQPPKKRTPRDIASEGVAKVRERASGAVQAGATAIDDAPLSALAGALAVGAVIAALIPNSQRELAALGPLGAKARGALDDAFTAAKGAGLEQLTAKGLSSTALSSGLGTVVGSVITAALAATNAANESVRKETAPRDSGDQDVSPPQGS